MSPPKWKTQIDPELRRLFTKLPNITFGPVTRRMFRWVERLQPMPRSQDGVTVRTQTLGSHALILFVPEGGPRHPGALLWVHGGGRVMGSPQQNAYHCERVARSLGIVVAATSYRLAPEHPFPAALDDCAASWAWLCDHADELGILADRIVVGGESAGGGLAAELAQRLHDEPGPSPVGQLLVYPMLDDRTATMDELTAQKHLVWNNASNHYGWSAYLGQPAGSDALPRYAAAARREDLSGLPPAWLTVGELDLFKRENEIYIERLRSAGVDAHLERIPGGFHGIFALGRDEPPMARVWESLLGFLGQRLGLD